MNKYNTNTMYFQHTSSINMKLNTAFIRVIDMEDCEKEVEEQVNQYINVLFLLFIFLGKNFGQNVGLLL